MKPEAALLRQTRRIALGVLALAAVMVAVYAVIGLFSPSVLLGALYTSALAILNFFIMGLTVQKITDTVGERQRTDEEIQTLSQQMKAKMQASYTLRMVVMFGLIAVGIAAFHFEPLATILPVVFPRIVIAVLRATGKAS